MGGADIGDDRAGRLDQSSQRGDFAGMVHANLPDGSLIAGFRRQNRKRNADVVIQVPLGFYHPVFGAKNGSRKLLGARLTAASGDSENLDFQARTPGGGEASKGFQAVFGEQHGMRDGEFFGNFRRVEQCYCSAALESLCRKFVPVEILPTQSDVEIPGFDCSGVLVEAGYRNSVVLAQKLGSSHRGNFRNREWVHQNSPPLLLEIARAATATSSKGTFRSTNS